MTTQQLLQTVLNNHNLVCEVSAFSDSIFYIMTSKKSLIADVDFKSFTIHNGEGELLMTQELITAIKQAWFQLINNSLNKEEKTVGKIITQDQLDNYWFAWRNINTDTPFLGFVALLYPLTKLDTLEVIRYELKARS